MVLQSAYTNTFANKEPWVFPSSSHCTALSKGFCSYVSLASHAPGPFVIPADAGRESRLGSVGDEVGMNYQRDGDGWTPASAGMTENTYKNGSLAGAFI